MTGGEAGTTPAQQAQQAAYGFTMPHIVSDVSISDPGKFCQFMLNNPEFAKALRALHLLDGAFACPASSSGRSGWSADFSPASLLTKVLSTALNLHILHIRSTEPLFQSHPAVYDTVTKLDWLKTISQLQGKLQDGPRPQGDVTWFGRYIESLWHIQLWEYVHMLDIGGCIAKISALARTFPNLRRLAFHIEFSIKQETGLVVCWPELDYLQMSVPIPLFPSCVRRLQLQNPISTRSESQNDLKTLPLMEKTNLVVLSITLSHIVLEVFLRRMKSSMLSLRYLEMVWQTFEDWVVCILAHSNFPACVKLTSQSVKVGKGEREGQRW
ncbi:hypothetical protein BD309DRAFT_993897 [Dichomitus squalens]|nr:hypothetical protein BD309DRAFT_993897 [Dichomitus squalens]